ncbi:MAG: trans-aconitate 2-methyltransferase [Arenibacterium sp.]
MTPEIWDAFLKLHRGLEREGPGEAADVAWAVECAGLRPDARIADAGCGPGADIAPLLAAAPQAEVFACDQVDHFVQAAQQRYAEQGNVQVKNHDMRDLPGRFDMIWCAAAIYFLGVREALRIWRNSLNEGGVIAFSDPCWRVETPSAAARATWSDYPAMTDLAGMQAAIQEVGYELLGTRLLSDAAWEAYYTPLDARIAALRPEADAAMTQVLDEAEAEAAAWRAHRSDFGYALYVVRPV